MGKFSKQGQYANAFSAKVTPKEHGNADKHWREAAKEELLRLIGQRGGFTVAGGVVIADERSRVKKLKGQGSEQKNQQLAELLSLLLKDAPTTEVVEKAQSITCGGEEQQLAQAIAKFAGSPQSVRTSDRAITTMLSTHETPSRAAENPFDIVVPVHKLARDKASALPFVPYFNTKLTNMFCPWQTASPYYSKERADRHTITQQVEFALYSIGAAVINENPHLLNEYHQICQSHGSPTDTQRKQQAFYTLMIGAYSLPEAKVVEGLNLLGRVNRFITFGTQGLRYPNGGKLCDANALSDLSLLVTGQRPHLTQGFELVVPDKERVPKLDMQCEENARLLDFVAEPKSLTATVVAATEKAASNDEGEIEEPVPPLTHK